jgi:hypothetical protein
LAASYRTDGRWEHCQILDEDDASCAGGQSAPSLIAALSGHDGDATAKAGARRAAGQVRSITNDHTTRTLMPVTAHFSCEDRRPGSRQAVQDAGAHVGVLDLYAHLEEYLAGPAPHRMHPASITGRVRAVKCD